ncbi:amidase [Silvibacterium dinghuense]|uniref:Amidase n=1 Tax=Silvibacterium dinghuense TaxID=1560006 RepID=A0A4Q1S8R7_9BACT|nr:amidase [Silvibacterium dinghuense]RXS93273.1 amidase [Silvibacterium dinghuense]GGH04488.1 amidase [Silvibacterium dinghuense]
MPSQTLFDRRTLLAVTSRLGIASALFPGALFTLAAQAQQDAQPGQALKPITTDMIDQAAALAGITIAPDQKQMLIAGLTQQREGYESIRKLHLPNSVPPAYIFDPLPPGAVVNTQKKTPVYSQAVATMPTDLEDLAFATVPQLADLVRRKKVSSLDLTEMYLRRLERYNPTLQFAVTLTRERALAQARDADAEIARGHSRGPLHGLPWGAKDLLAVKGYPTTWGAGGFEHQVIDEDATVVQRLDAAGAVLVAKLTLGALAMGDYWFGGRTRNPWNPKQGSSGSSAGPASATSAGCVAFSIGSETLGSISSPSTRCGVTGLRPTFGFVPRTGAMTLSWTMDKLGPICRAVEDCAIVMQAIYGPDGQDLAAREAAFNWNADLDWRKLRVGYIVSEFEADKPEPEQPAKPDETAEERTQRETARRENEASHARRAYDRNYDLAALDKLRAMGVSLVPVELPKLPYDAMAALLTAEAAAAFDELTRSGRDRLLTRQTEDDWPNLFRIHRFYPAVEYIQANRARTLAIREISTLFEQVDIIVAASSSVQLTATNLTGHPAVIVPNGLRGPDAPTAPVRNTGDDDQVGGPGTPVSLTFLGGHYQDAKLCAFARAYQEATGFHTSHPRLA